MGNDMILNEIQLGASETNKLIELVEEYNKNKPYSLKRTFQEHAEKLLEDAIWFEYNHMMQKRKGV